MCPCSRTLQPHVFVFTVCNVKAGQEALLDYGSVSAATLLPVAPCSCSSMHLGKSVLTGVTWPQLNTPIRPAAQQAWPFLDIFKTVFYYNNSLLVKIVCTS